MSPVGVGGGSVRFAAEGVRGDVGRRNGSRCGETADTVESVGTSGEEELGFRCLRAVSSATPRGDMSSISTAPGGYTVKRKCKGTQAFVTYQNKGREEKTYCEFQRKLNKELSASASLGNEANMASRQLS